MLTEWFDYGIYAYGVTYISAAIFPGIPPAAGMLLAFDGRLLAVFCPGPTSPGRTRLGPARGHHHDDHQDQREHQPQQLPTALLVAAAVAQHEPDDGNNQHRQLRDLRGDPQRRQPRVVREHEPRDKRAPPDDLVGSAPEPRTNTGLLTTVNQTTARQNRPGSRPSGNTSSANGMNSTIDHGQA